MVVLKLSESFRFEIILFYYLQIFGVFLILSLFVLSLGSVVFDVTPEDPHFFVEIVIEVEVVEFSQPELAVVVV